MATLDKISIKNFRKSRLPQGSLAEIARIIHDLCSAADIETLAPELEHLQSKTDLFNHLIHPIMGSALTPQIANADQIRDHLLISFNHYIYYALYHYDPELVAAARNIQVVMKSPAYKHMYSDSYDLEHNTVQHFINELRTNRAQDVATLNLGEFLDKLEEADQHCEKLIAQRASKTARTYNYSNTKTARAELEDAIDMLRLQVNALALHDQLEGGNTYDKLIATINTHIDQAVLGASANKKEKRKKQQKTNENTPA